MTCKLYRLLVGWYSVNAAIRYESIKSVSIGVNSKFQAPNSKKVPRFKFQVPKFSLSFLVKFIFVIWNLELGIYGAQSTVVRE
jgi:hypothetical protein